MGYSYFNIPNMTVKEINILVSAYNREQKEKERAQKRANMRGR